MILALYIHYKQKYEFDYEDTVLTLLINCGTFIFKDVNKILKKQESKKVMKSENESNAF